MRPSIPRPSTAGRVRAAQPTSSQELTPRGTSTSAANVTPFLVGQRSSSLDLGATATEASVTTGRSVVRCTTAQSVAVQCDLVEPMMAVKQHTEICRLQRAQLDSTERVLQQLRMVPTQSQALNELSKSRDEAIEKWTASQQEVAHLRQLLRLKQEEVAALRIQQNRLSLVSSTSTSTTSLAAQGKGAVGSASARSVLLDALRPAIVIDVTSALPVPEILSHRNSYQSDEAQGRSVDSVAVRHQQLEEAHDEDVAHPQLRHVDYRTARPARDWAASCGPSHRLMAAQQDVSPCVEMVLQSVGHTATGAVPSSWIQEALGGPTAATVAEATAADGRPNSSVLGERSWRAALAAQEAIIQSLETENKSLRQDRDEKIRLGQQEHKRLMEELEEAQTTLDENSAEWQEKQRELNRLRTLMRFSQLKRDSDRLQEMYKRLDELENTIRHHHAAQRSIAMDQDDLQRLRSVEVQLVKVMEGQMQWRSFPFSLLKTTRRTAAAAANGALSVATAAAASAPPPLSSMAAAAPVADRMRPSSMTLSGSGGANQALPAAPPQAANTAQPLLQHTTVERRRDDTVVGGTPSAIPMEEKERSAVEVNADSSSRGGLSASSRAAGAASVRQPPAPPEDHDVSFSTIAARMEEYLRKKQAEQLTRGGPKPGPSSSSSEAASNGAGAPTLLQRQQAQADTLCQSNFVRRLERLKTRQENPSGGIPLTSGGAVGGGGSGGSMDSLKSSGLHHLPSSSTTTTTAAAYGRFGRPTSAHYSSATGAQRSQSSSTGSTSAVQRPTSAGMYTYTNGRMVLSK